MYKVEDIQFELLERFIELEGLGFKECIFVDNEGNHHEVHSIGSPDQGYGKMDILEMSEEDFKDLVWKYTN